MTIIPQELIALPRWVLWKSEERDGKSTKVPYQKNGHHASSTDSSTWTTMAGLRGADPSVFTGVGFVLGSPYTGIDLDKCRDADTGDLEPWAKEIVTSLNSFTEISPSGRGLHIFIKGNLPAGRNRRGKLEAYSTGRYFTMTGNHLAGTPESIREISDDELTAWHGKYLLTAEPGATTTATANADTSCSAKEFKAMCEALRQLGPSATDDDVRLEFFKRVPLRDKLNREDYLRRTIKAARDKVFPKGQAEPQAVADIALKDMPTSVLDGWLGELCRTRLGDFPVAYVWPALVAVAGAMVPRPDARSPRVNLYAALVGPKGSGKSTAIEYAGKLLGIDGATLVKMMVGSPEGLVKHLGGGSRLLSVDELGHLLAKAQIQGSTFSHVLNRAFYDDQFDVVMAKKIKETFSCHLSVLGGMVDELFQDGFGSATTGGLHDRFVFGQCPTGFMYHYRPFEGGAAEIESDAFGKAIRPIPVTIDASVWQERDRWIDELGIAPSVSELAIRVATICASWDGRNILTAVALGPALEFAQYQTRARVLLQPNAGENFEARIALKMLSYLKRHAPNGELVSRRKMFLDINAYKVGLSIAKKALEALAFNGDVLLSKNGKMPAVRLVTQ